MGNDDKKRISVYVAIVMIGALVILFLPQIAGFGDKSDREIQILEDMVYERDQALLKLRRDRAESEARLQSKLDALNVKIKASKVIESKATAARIKAEKDLEKTKTVVADIRSGHEVEKAKIIAAIKDRDLLIKALEEEVAEVRVQLKLTNEKLAEVMKERNEQIVACAKFERDYAKEKALRLNAEAENKRLKRQRIVVAAALLIAGIIAS